MSRRRAWPWPCIAAALLPGVAQAATVPAASFYGLSAVDIDGGTFEFERLRGAAAVVITNVASE